MLRRELGVREKEILLMIRPTTFHDIVDAVRRDIENDRYNVRRQLRDLKNGNNGNNGNNCNNRNNGNNYNNRNNGENK